MQNTRNKLSKLTIVFLVADVCDTHKTSILHSVQPEVQTYQLLEPPSITFTNKSQALHVVVVVDESNSKARRRMKSDADSPNIRLRGNAGHCTD